MRGGPLSEVSSGRLIQRPPPTNKPHTADAPRPAPHRTAPQPIMPADSDKRAAAQQAVDILHEISTILVRIAFALALAPVPPPRARRAS